LLSEQLGQARRPAMGNFFLGRIAEKMRMNSTSTAVGFWPLMLACRGSLSSFARTANSHFILKQFV
jgi:hypothetical protein